MQSKQVDKLALNAGIERLCAGEEEGWVESAMALAAFAQSVPPSNPGSNIMLLDSSQSQSGSHAGFAAGVGNVTIPESQQSSHVEKYVGIHVARIGSYKVWHYAGSATMAGQIFFKHYKEMWPYFNPINEDSFVVYWLAYDTNTLEPTAVLASMYEKRENNSFLGSLRMFWETFYFHIIERGNSWKALTQSKTLNFYTTSCTVLLSNDPTMKSGDDVIELLSI